MAMATSVAAFRIFVQNRGELRVQRIEISGFQERDLSKLGPDKVIIRDDVEGALVKLARFAKTARGLIGKRRFHQKAEVAWIEINAAFEISDCFSPATLAAINRAGEDIDLGIVRERPAGEIELGPGAIVIESPGRVRARFRWTSPVGRRVQPLRL